MLIAFERYDFSSAAKWQSFLEKINVPGPVQSNVIGIVIETKKIHASESIGGNLNVVKYNPDTEVQYC